MVALFVALLALVVVAVNVLIAWGISACAIIPLVEAFGGPELPLVPVAIVVWLVLCLATSRININTTKS